MLYRMNHEKIMHFVVSRDLQTLTPYVIDFLPSHFSFLNNNGAYQIKTTTAHVLFMRMSSKKLCMKEERF
jgi:hypothetical protein